MRGLNVPLAELRSPAIASTRTNTESMTLADTERQAILRALREADRVIARAAAKLGMKRTTLNSKIRKLGSPAQRSFRTDSLP